MQKRQKTRILPVCVCTCVACEKERSREKDLRKKDNVSEVSCVAKEARFVAAWMNVRGRRR